jgi:hypothetical protein
VICEVSILKNVNTPWKFLKDTMSILDKLAAISVITESTGSSVAQLVADKEYHKLQRWLNVSSYSMLEVLHDCPRKFQLSKVQAFRAISNPTNLDFVFGHAVGSGIQAWIQHMDSPMAESQALMNCVLAWRADFDARNEKKGKSLYEACQAVLQYIEWYEANMGEWVVWVAPNGKPAIELSFEVDFENGFFHYGHIDVILQNRHTGMLAVQENKTHGFRTVEPAIYVNSDQGVGYGAVLDMLAAVTSYDVYYNCYSSTSREWEVLPFRKSVSSKVEWIRSIQLDHAAIDTYDGLNFYPKRGSSCFNFMRRCQYLGECNMTATLPKLQRLSEGNAEKVDFKFKVSEMLAKQSGKAGIEAEAEDSLIFNMENIDYE